MVDVFLHKNLSIGSLPLDVILFPNTVSFTDSPVSLSANSSITIPGTVQKNATISLSAISSMVGGSGGITKVGYVFLGAISSTYIPSVITNLSFIGFSAGTFLSTSPVNFTYGLVSMNVGGSVVVSAQVFQGVIYPLNTSKRQMSASDRSITAIPDSVFQRSGGIMRANIRRS